MEILTPKMFADEYHLKLSTLAKWRSLRKPPAYFKAGGAVRYTRAAIDEWNADRNKPPLKTPLTRGGRKRA